MTVPRRHGWLALASGVYARRHRELDLTTGLVVGAEACLLVDTGVDDRRGADVARAVRAVTPLPWTVVLTHGHFDHCFGTAAFTPCEVLAQRRCPDYLDETLDAQRAEWGARFPRIREVAPVRPTRTVAECETLDLGGRSVVLRHFGPAHTDHDLVVHVPDAGVLFAGDLVEQGAPPSVGPDSAPGNWPHVLDRMLALAPGLVVPGHGDPVDAAFVRAQREELFRHG